MSWKEYALALLNKTVLSSVSGTGFHGLSQVLYQYTTSAANKGSSFAGLSGNTLYWNITTGIVMLIGRYV